MTSFPRAAWPALLVALTVTGQAAPLSQSRNAARLQTRPVFVTVVDDAGRPVLDLTPANFDVSEGGTKRTVLRAGLATSPMRIALMVDTSDAASAAIPHIRTGLLAFLDTLGPDHEVMLVTTGRQMRVRVQMTKDRKKVEQAAGALFGDGGGTPLMDALMEVDKRFMSKIDDRWPVYVIVTSDGTESSTGAEEKEFNRWIDSLRYRAATAHAIVIKSKGNSGLPEVIAMNTTNNTGGRYDAILVTNGLPDKLKALATQMNSAFTNMASRYQIDFETDTAGALTNVEVGVDRERVKMQVSYRRQFP